MQFTSSVPENPGTPKPDDVAPDNSKITKVRLQLVAGDKPRQTAPRRSPPADPHKPHRRRVMPSPFRDRPLPVVENNEVLVTDLESFARMWLDVSKRANTPQTFAAKADMTGRFLWFLNSRGYEHCGTDEIEAYLDHVTNGHLSPLGRWDNDRNRKPMRPVTVKGHYTIVRALFSYIVKRRFIAQSPVAMVEAPKPKKDRLFLFTEEEIQLLLAATVHSWHPRRDEAIVWLLYDTGLRATELCELNRCHIDTRNQRLTVRGKGDKIRVLSVGDAAFKAVWDYLRENEIAPDEPLFRLSRGVGAGARLTPRSLRYTITQLGKVAGVSSTRCSPHTFRHTFATHFLKRSGNLYALRDMLGHSTLTQTLQYAHLAQVDVATQHGAYSPGDWLAGLRE